MHICNDGPSVLLSESVLAAAAAAVNFNVTASAGMAVSVLGY
jgi:hypothetical protein